MQETFSFCILDLRTFLFMKQCLQTLFGRESAAGSYSIRIYYMSSYSLERIMASPLFRTHSDILAGLKTGSRKVVGLKMPVW